MTDTAAPRVAHLLLVEGVPGLGKSTILDRLARRHVAAAEPRRLRTLVHLTQAHTYGPVAPGEDAGTLTRAENLAHLARVVDMLEWLATSVATERVPKCFVLVDTLHLTHCLRPGILPWHEVEPLDARLAAVGCRLLLLHADDATIRERSVEARAGTSFVRDYALRRFARTEQELVDYFRQERDEFRRMAASSRMPCRVVAAELSEETIVEEAFAFWRDSGSGA